MKIQTFSIVVGGKKCNASCPYCVSKMTGDKGLCKDINYRNFRKACLFAKQSGVSTVLLTGKGEPLLYPDLITDYLEALKEFDFPFIELQTNGIALSDMDSVGYKNSGNETYLEKWYELGLTTICLSTVHWSGGENRKIYGKKYTELHDYVDICHREGFSVRVSCVMYTGGVCSLIGVRFFSAKCKEWGVEQFTARGVSNDIDFKETTDSKKKRIYNWVEKHRVSPIHINDIREFFDCKTNATLLLELAHGAKVYDYEGQNISINSCLTHSPNPDDIRQLIFFPDGHLRYSWQYRGAIII